MGSSPFLLFMCLILHSGDLQHYPDNESSGEPSEHGPNNSERLAQTRKGQRPITSSPNETPHAGSHADDYDPDQVPDPNPTEDGLIGKNTKAVTHHLSETITAIKGTYTTEKLIYDFYCRIKTS